MGNRSDFQNTNKKRESGERGKRRRERAEFGGRREKTSLGGTH